MEKEVLNTKGSVVEKIKLNEEVWNEAYNEDLIVQAVLVYQNNKRVSAANAKTRGEVSGTGAKPWAQKGTGRARHGSKRSPIWVGGGVTFVPSDRNWKKRMNKRMKIKALSSILSYKLDTEAIKLIDMSDFDRADVKDFKKLTVVTDNNSTYLSLRNLPNIVIIRSEDLNALDVVSAESIYLDKDSTPKLEERILNGK